jgi:hypothetical protein
VPPSDFTTIVGASRQAPAISSRDKAAAMNGPRGERAVMPVSSVGPPCGPAVPSKALMAQIPQMGRRTDARTSSCKIARHADGPARLTKNNLDKFGHCKWLFYLNRLS